MRRKTGTLLACGGALLALGAFDSARAASPAGFTTRVEPPADLSGFTATQTSAGDELAFTTRIGGVATSFSIDRSDGKDPVPRMRWSHPLGSTLAGARVASDGWSFTVTGGIGGDEAAGSTALLTQGAARSRSGWSTGLEYDFGPWQLGGYYQFSHTDLGFTPAGQVESGYGLGANYTVVPGLSLFSEAFFYNDVGRAPLAAGQSSGTGGSSLKPQAGKLYVIGTHLEW
jgi:hypothetical protein